LLSLRTRYSLRAMRVTADERTVGADERFSGRYLACCLNYEQYICELFSNAYSLGTMPVFTLQCLNKDLYTANLKKWLGWTSVPREILSAYQAI